MIDFGMYMVDFGMYMIDLGMYMVDFGMYMIDFGMYMIDFGMYIYIPLFITHYLRPIYLIMVREFHFHYNTNILKRAWSQHNNKK